MYSSISKTSVSLSNHGLSTRKASFPTYGDGSVTLNALQLRSCTFPSRSSATIAGLRRCHLLEDYLGVFGVEDLEVVGAGAHDLPYLIVGGPQGRMLSHEVLSQLFDQILVVFCLQVDTAMAQ